MTSGNVSRVIKIGVSTLLGVTPLGSNKHRRTSEEDERKKEYDPE